MVTGNIFGGFTGGIFNNNLGVAPGLLPGQAVPFNPNFNPTPILNQFFQPFPWAANSLVTSMQISLAGGGTPLIASYPTISPFTNPFLNMFNPAVASGLGGLPPNTGQGNLVAGGGANDLSRLGLGNRNTNVRNTNNLAARNNLAAMSGFGLANVNSFASFGGFGGFGNFGGFGFLG
jgi:hypothetical protein